MVHPDRPGSWVRFTPGLCTDCRADCCGLPVEVRGEDLVRLGLVDEYQWQDSPSKAARRLVREGVLQSWRGGTGIGILALFVHDVCDIFLEFTKINVYLKTRGGKYRPIHEKLSTIGFLGFATVW